MGAQLEVNSKELLEKALTHRTPLALFLDSCGEQLTVGPAPSDTESDAFRLDEAMTRFSPSFQICTAINGVLTNRGGDPISIDDLPNAIKDAEEERIRFYTEKEEDFGPSAWPGSKGVTCK